ncbi:MAG: ribonuclease III [Eubacterium sp.]|nr:ribonuclease III [Eubacterium sp.]
MNPAQLSPLNLAYIGDTVFDLVVRTSLVCTANEPVRSLNRKAASIVNAGSQSRMAERLLPLFTEEEAAVYQRGRNAKCATHAKNASVAEYHRATGVEAVFGYLYLLGKKERILQLFREALPELKLQGEEFF